MSFAAGADVVDGLLSNLASLGTVGIVLVLIILGVLVTGRQLTQVQDDRDSWRKAYEAEREAHSKTREALAAAETRGEAALEAARTATQLLQSMGHALPEGHR